MSLTLPSEVKQQAVDIFDIAAKCEKLLAPLTNKEALKVLQLLGAIRNLKVSSSFMAAPAQIASQPGAPRKNPPLKRVRSEGEVALEQELNATKKLIKDESAKTGLALPSDHPLIKARNALLERIRLFRAGIPVRSNQTSAQNETQGNPSPAQENSEGKKE